MSQGLLTYETLALHPMFILGSHSRQLKSDLEHLSLVPIIQSREPHMSSYWLGDQLYTKISLGVLSRSVG